MDLERHQITFTEMLFMGKGRKDSDIPPYGGATLDGLYPQGGISFEEDKHHLGLGSFGRRLASIVSQTRTKVFDDMFLDPTTIEIGVKTEEGYPGGRIYTVVKKIPMQGLHNGKKEE